MSDGPNMVNIGTIENPIYVPEHALEPESDKGRSFHGGIATGSINLDRETFEALYDRLSEGDE